MNKQVQVDGLIFLSYFEGKSKKETDFQSAKMVQVTERDFGKGKGLEKIVDVLDFFCDKQELCANLMPFDIVTVTVDVARLNAKPTLVSVDKIEKESLYYPRTKSEPSGDEIFPDKPVKEQTKMKA